MTTRELREMLFFVENQELTIKQLRSILLEIENQDAKLEHFDIFKLTKQLSKPIAKRYKQNLN